METTRPSLLLRIRDRSDAAAWAEFDSIYRPMLSRIAAARGLDPATADDIVQECMAAVHRHIGGFQYDPERGRFKGWLRTLVNNRFRNLLRDKHDYLAESEDFKRPQEREQSPEDLFDQMWREEHLKHCLRQIRDEVEDSTFRAFVAYVIEEQSVESVCEELRMSPNQVHAIKSRLTRRLHARMTELMGDDE
jgi:RNA polymerase sigma-70 factor (ECF subfamily)